ncbi:protein kinase, partial [Acidimicrobiaceae bacterium USS-CC1]|nr:protein kinase [Acidiferrimicrobium australe]
MAEVWEGRDEVLGRAVAVKVLQSHLSGDAVFVERFRREAVTAAAVSSPSIVATYDAGLDDGTAYIVMELVDGRTLRQLLDGSGALDVGLAVEIAAQIADALGRAHRAGLVHRDVKPANVLVCDDEDGGVRAKVTDFGIAKARAGLGADLTQTGTVLGTPKYLSPEQIQGRHEVDERADLYSLGIVLFEMLTGQVPFTGPADMTIALAHLHDPAPRVRSLRPAVPAALDDLVARLLAKTPEERPASASEVRRALLAAPPAGVHAALADTT